MRVSVIGKRGWHRGVRFAGAWGTPALTRHQTAFVAALASVSLFALVHSAAAETTAAQSGVKSASKTAVKTAAKHGKHTKKADAKGKDKKDKKATKLAALEVPLPRSRPGASDAAIGATTASGPGARARISPSKPPLAQAPTPETTDSDIALVKRAIDALRNSGTDEATRIEASIDDPVARKLVEWIILRADSNGVAFSRYAAFISANPTWPSVNMFRRRAEAMLWVEDASPAKIRSYFSGSQPLSAKGRLVLARALLEA